MVPFRVDGKVVQFLNHPHQQFLVLSRGCHCPEHVILVASTVGAQASHISLKAHEEVEPGGVDRDGVRQRKLSGLGAGAPPRLDVPAVARQAVHRRVAVPIAAHVPHAAISARQARNTVATRTEQNIYKTELDFASPLAYSKRIRGNYKVNLVSITDEVPNQAIVGAHSIEQFAPEIESVASSGLVTVERNTMLSSVKKSAGSVIALGITAYDTAKEMKQDRATGDEIQKAAKQTITVAEQTEEFVADNAIMDVGLALAPETYGLSIVAALGATVIHNLAVSHFAAELKDEASAGIAKVENWFKKVF